VNKYRIPEVNDSSLVKRPEVPVSNQNTIIIKTNLTERHEDNNMLHQIKRYNHLIFEETNENL